MQLENVTARRRAERTIHYIYLDAGPGACLSCLVIIQPARILDHGAHVELDASVYANIT